MGHVTNGIYGDKWCRYFLKNCTYMQVPTMTMRTILENREKVHRKVVVLT